MSIGAANEGLQQVCARGWNRSGRGRARSSTGSASGDMTRYDGPSCSASPPRLCPAWRQREGAAAAAATSWLRFPRRVTFMFAVPRSVFHADVA
eukprot:365338-Chlamydomonas_euryale.AAC.2